METYYDDCQRQAQTLKSLIEVLNGAVGSDNQHETLRHSIMESCYEIASDLTTALDL